MNTRVLLLALMACIAAVVAWQYPEVRRYMKVRAM